MHWASGSCRKGDTCIFFHGERPLPSILHTGDEPVMTRYVPEMGAVDRVAAIAPGPIRDVRIYICNVPSDNMDATMTNKQWIETFAAQYGRVVSVKMLESRVPSGSVAGFIRMSSSEAEADRLVAQLNMITVGGRVIRARKERVLGAVRPKPSGTTAADAADGFVCKTSKGRRPSSESVRADTVPRANLASPFSVLMTLEVGDGGGDADDDGEITRGELAEKARETSSFPMVNKKQGWDVSPTKVVALNPWSDSRRSFSMRRDLAIETMENRDINTALIADAAMHKAGY